MKNRTRHILLFLVLSLLTVSQAAAQEEFTEDAETDKRAQTGFKFLSYSPDARAAALGSAMTAVEHASSAALFYNPAGMAGLDRTFHVSAGNTQWIADIGYNTAAAAFSPSGGAFGVFGVSLMMIDYGEVVGTVVDENAPDGYSEYGSIGLGNPTPTSMSVGFGYANAITDRFAVGGQIKYARQDIGTVPIGGGETRSYDKGAVAFDLGVLYNTGFRSLNFAMSVRNFAQEVKYVQDNFELPLTFRIGLAMDVMDLTSMNPDMHSFLLAVDAERPRDFDEHVKIGGEYTFMDLLALRAGYAYPADEQGATFGVGLTPSFGGFTFGFDYAYTSFGVFDEVHRLGVNLGF